VSAVTFQDTVPVKSMFVVLVCVNTVLLLHSDAFHISVMVQLTYWHSAKPMY